MDEIWKYIIYAAVIGLYYIVKGLGKKSEDKPADAAKPFMSPSAKPSERQAVDKRRIPTPRATHAPSSLEDMLRRFNDQDTLKPAPMLEDKVKQQNQSAEAYQSQEGRSLETSANTDYLETKVPFYRNEASQVDYEVSGKNDYKGLNDASKDRFDEFAVKKAGRNRYADLLQNPESVKDAFVLGEIFNRKEY